MFIRRLGFLYALSAAVVVVMVLQLSRLTLAEGADHLADAESRLDQRTFLATYRGRILDRKGRVLAADRPSYDIAVEYEVLTGAWAAHEAAVAARKEVGRTAWSEMDPSARGRAIERHLTAFDAQVERLYATICDRGGIDRDELERRIDEIKRRVHTRAVAVWDRQREMESNRLGDDSTFTARPIREQRRPHVLLPQVPDSVAFEFARLADEIPDTIVVQESTRREYPLSELDVTVDRSTLPGPIRSDKPVTLRLHGVADHIVGDMRSSVYASDLERRPFLDPATGRLVDLGGYRPVNDVVGARGIERSREDELRGIRGLEEIRLDTGTERRIEPTPGRDVQLTIDIELQARVQALMTPALGLAKVQQWHRGWRGGVPNTGPLPLGWDLNGAAVVLDVDTGEVLALVSIPTFADGLLMDEGRRGMDQPFVHRAVETAYPPGSILKPLVYTSAVTAGVHGLHSAVTCTGHYFPNNESICRCWIYREHYGFTTHSNQIGGPLDVVQAIARSCNIYFYTVADRMGARRLVDWLGRFGLGHVLDIGLLATMTDKGDVVREVGEGGGSLPSATEVAALETSGARSTMVMMGIGQGPIGWTPLQAANAYATMARSGAIRDATLIMNDERSSLRERSGDMNLDPQAVTLALEGLRDSIEKPYGTGNHITYEDGHTEPIVTAPGVIAWAKTGTAQAPRKRFDTNGDGMPDTDVDGLDHAWFVGLVGSAAERRPRYAIAVVLEYGGSGGRVAGPVANQIILALQDLGYLPRPEAAPSAGKGAAR